MYDLNDLYYFAKIVEHGGFSEASKSLRIPKSKLSRHLSSLEERLGVKLIQRTTRHFTVTDIGLRYYDQCQSMLKVADTAQALIENVQEKPKGLVRISCPVTLLHYDVSPMIIKYMQNNPEVEIVIEAKNNRVDVIHEGIDIAFRVLKPPLEDSELVMKTYGLRQQILVASPSLIEELGEPKNPEDLYKFPSMALSHYKDRNDWELWADDDTDGKLIKFSPRLMTTDMEHLLNSAIAGIGIVQLPTMVVKEAIEKNQLVHILPNWHFKKEILHVVFPSRKGLLPAVRSLLDFFNSEFQRIER